MTSLAENRASGGTSISVQCLSFSCPVWEQSIHICTGYEDITATIDTGETVSFIAADFSFTPPSVKTSGSISITLALDGYTPINESDDAPTAIELVDIAISAREVIAVEMREFMLHTLDEQGTDTERLTIQSYSFDPASGQLDCPAAYYDFVNQTWPPKKRNYSASRQPGLKHYA